MIRSFERPEESANTRLRHLMQQGMIVVPFVYDALQAKIVQNAGLQAVYMTGFGTERACA